METSPLFKFLLIVNALGALYGFVFYYGDALLTTNPLLWPFVPDCPLYALLFAVALILVSEKSNAGWFYFLVFVGAVKYGFWTLYVLWNYWGWYSPDGLSLMYLALFISHVVLFLEPAVLLGRISVRKEWLGIALFWFLINDFVDYGLGPFSTHPPMPPEHTGTIFTMTMLMTFAFSLGSYWLIRRFEPKTKQIRRG